MLCEWVLCKKNNMPGSKVAKLHKGPDIEQKSELHERLDDVAVKASMGDQDGKRK